MLELWAAITLLAILLFVVMVVVKGEIRELEKSLSLAKSDIINLQDRVRQIRWKANCDRGFHDYDFHTYHGKKVCRHCQKEIKYTEVTNDADR